MDRDTTYGFDFQHDSDNFSILCCDRLTYLVLFHHIYQSFQQQYFLKHQSRFYCKLGPKYLKSHHELIIWNCHKWNIKLLKNITSVRNTDVMSHQISSNRIRKKAYRKSWTIVFNIYVHWIFNAYCYLSVSIANQTSITYSWRANNSNTIIDNQNLFEIENVSVNGSKQFMHVHYYILIFDSLILYHS